MAATAALPRWTVEQYLDLERASDVRHEYVDGVVYALAGGAQRHGAICAATVGLLFAALRGGPCRVYSSDLKIRVSATRYFYPDVSVDCAPVAPGADDDDSLSTPRLVVEVLSDSTPAYDWGAKRFVYQALPSLHTLMLVETKQRLIEVYARGGSGRWTVQRYGVGEEVALPGLSVRLAVDDIYVGGAID